MSEKTVAQQQVDVLLAEARGVYPTCSMCSEDLIPHDEEPCGGCAKSELAAAEERGRRRGVEEEHKRAESVIHVLHQCIRGKCDCGPGQFACEETARKMIDSWPADRVRKA